MQAWVAADGLTQWNFASVRQSFAASCCVGWHMRCEHCSSMRLNRTSCGLPPGGGRFGSTTVILLSNIHLLDLILPLVSTIASGQGWQLELHCNCTVGRQPEPAGRPLKAPSLPQLLVKLCLAGSTDCRQRPMNDQEWNV